MKWDKSKWDNRANFKFNGGLGALLCSECSVIIKTGRDFTEEETQGILGKLELPAQFCQNCKDKEHLANNKEHLADDKEQ
jgi:hypothetical protein